MQELIKAKAIELLENGTVDRVLGWKAGEFFYDLTPAVFTSREEIEKDFVYSVFSGANLSKYLVKESRKDGKVAAFLKPCDTYSFNQLLKEHRIWRDNVPAQAAMAFLRDIHKSRHQVLPVMMQGNLPTCQQRYPAGCSLPRNRIRISANMKGPFLWFG